MPADRHAARRAAEGTGVNHRMAVRAKASTQAENSPTAQATAAKGVARVAAAGLNNVAAVKRLGSSVLATFLRLTDEHDAGVVLGLRGRSELAAALPSSKSNAVVSHASRPVVVVPPGPSGGEPGAG